ncbi:MAG: IS110 family transposase [Anaerolineae bacterium]|nr:IS110 family transposase [Anaerolineae bacterium]
MASEVRFVVALDLGKYKHTATILDLKTGQPAETLVIEVNQAGFARLEKVLTKFSRQPEEMLIGCEATGHYGETLLRRLQVQGYGIVRLNPAQVVQFRRGLGRRAKTDALDADALARQMLVTTHAPERPISPTAYSLQRLTRLRLDFVEEQARWLNRVRALLNQLFPELEALLKDLTCKSSLQLLMAFPSRQQIAQASLDDLTSLLRKNSHGMRGQTYAQHLQVLARQSVGLDDAWLVTEFWLVLGQLAALTDSIENIEQEIERLTEQYLEERSRELGLAAPLTVSAFPLRSPLTLGTLLGELGAVERFPSLKHLLSYLGWCPQTQESGTLVNPHPKLSPRGNRFVRRVLWMWAIAAVRWVPEYRCYFQQRIALGKSKMKTLVAFARKLLSVLFAILRTGQPYDPQRHLQRQAASPT